MDIVVCGFVVNFMWVFCVFVALKQSPSCKYASYLYFTQIMQCV